MITPIRRGPLLRLFLGLVGFVLLIFLVGCLFLVFERFSASRELRATKEKLTAEGILKPLSELAPTPSREAVAQGEKYLSAIAAIAPMSKEDRGVVVDLEIAPMVTPGIATASAQRVTPVFSESPEKTHLASWEELRQRVAPAVPILASARQLLQTPLGYDFDLTSFKSIIPADDPQRLIPWLRADALLQLHDGHIPSTLDDMEAIAQNALFVGTSRSIISYMLMVGMWNYGLDNLIWEVLQSPSLTEADLIRLDLIAHTAPTLQDALRSAEVETSIQPGVLHTFADLPSDQTADVLSLSGQGIFRVPQVEALRVFLWKKVWMDRDEAITLTDFGRQIKEFRDLMNRKGANPLAKQTIHLPPAAWRFPWSSTMADFNAIQGVLQTAIQFETQRQLILAAIALERYRLNHGHYPASLADLVPAYLPQLPYDWFAAQPLQYRPPTVAKPYVLYSVGKDRVDQGGDPTSNRKGNAPRPSSGRDFVWPQPEKSSSAAPQS